MQNLQIDEEFQSLIPPLTPDELAQLESNLIADGCRDPLVLWDGIIVDGHNRYRICTEHHILFKTVDKQFSSRDDAILWIIDNQRGRRNLSDGARAMLELRAEPILRAKAKERQREHGGTAPGKTLPQNSAEVKGKGDTREAIAKRAGVSHDTVDKVKKIVTEGTDEQKRRIWEGASVRSVYREIHPPKPKDASVPNEPPAPEPDLNPIPDPMPTPSKSHSLFNTIVTDLKDEGKDASCTPELFISEYQGFTSKFIKSLEWYQMEYYCKVYSKLSSEDHKKITALNTAMLEAVKKLNELQKGNQNEKAD